MIEKHPTFGALGYAPGAMNAADFDLAQLGSDGTLSDSPLKSPVTDFYMTNPIARASNVMAECSAGTGEPTYSEAAE
jgi:NADH-quinone oxidoreductase subunit G